MACAWREERRGLRNQSQRNEVEGGVRVAEWNGGEKKVDAQMRTPPPLSLRAFRISVMAAGFSIILTVLRGRLGARKGGH